MPQSILNRGSDTILNIGAWNDSPPAVDLNISLVDNVAVSESVSFTSTPTSYPFNSLMRRGSSEDTIHHLGLDIGAWQTPFPRVAGIMPSVPEIPTGHLRNGPFDVGGLQTFDMLIDDLFELISYKIQVISGLAGDRFTDDFIPFNFYTKHLLITTWDNPIDIVLTRHGQESFYSTVENFGFLKKLSVRGYKIKNTTPGQIARYQLIVLG